VKLGGIESWIEKSLFFLKKSFCYCLDQNADAFL